MTERTIKARLIILLSAILLSCSGGGPAEQSCSVTEGRVALKAGGFPTEGLSIIEGCGISYDGPREGAEMLVIAAGTKDSIYRALGAGGVDIMTASSSVGDAKENPPAFHVRVALEGDEPGEGDRRTFRDSVSHEGRTWRRYIAWGQSVDQPGRYLIMVVLENGSM